MWLAMLLKASVAVTPFHGNPRMLQRLNDPILADFDENGQRDLGVLMNILYTRDEEFDNLRDVMPVLRPRFASLMIDTWKRPAGMSAEQVRQEVYANHSDVLALFDQVHFETSGNRTAWDAGPHTFGCFPIRAHWSRVFGDRDPDVRSGSQGGLWGNGVPSILMAVEPDEAPRFTDEGFLNQAARVLHAVAARRQVIDRADGGAARRASRAAAEASAKAIWLNATGPLPTNAHNVWWKGLPKGDADEDADPTFVRDKPGKGSANDRVVEIAGVQGTLSMQVSTQAFLFHRNDLDYFLHLLEFWKTSFQQLHARPKPDCSNQSEPERCASQKFQTWGQDTLRFENMLTDLLPRSEAALSVPMSHSKVEVPPPLTPLRNGTINRMGQSTELA